jgi:archaellum biogenesis ATPase FlaH
VPVELELASFFNKIWKEVEGTVRTATKDSEGKFITQLYSWPEDIGKVVDVVNRAAADELDVFYSPDIYTVEALKQKKFTKDLVLGSHVICLDFDGNAPQEDSWYEANNLPLPSVKVQSSTEDRQHVYWILDQFVTDVKEMENIRRTITYSLEADSSGWDMGQLLRVPYTTNYKHGKKETHEGYPVRIEEDTDRVYPVSKFPRTDRDFRPLLASRVDVDNLPDLQDVLIDNQFDHAFKRLFKEKVEDLTQRSGALSKLAHFCAEAGLSEAEMYTVIADADSRWGKYSHRKDKHLRYIDLIDLGKTKHPHKITEINVTDETEVRPQRGYTFAEFRAQEFKIEWLYSGWLPLGGYGVIVGPPNVGKTQIAIRLAEAAALGQKFLQWDFVGTGPVRVMLYSLEMGAVPLAHFFNLMPDLEDKALENLYVYPIGENLMLDDPKKKALFLSDVDAVRPGLIIIDSLAQVGTKSLNDDEAIRKTHEIFRQVRKLANCAIVVVHHYKKAQEKSHTGDLDSMYGGIYIGAEADTVLAFLPHREDPKSREVTAIRVICSKIRLGPWIPTFGLLRQPGLQFQVTEGDPADESSGGEFIASVRGFTERANGPVDPDKNLF